MPDSATDMASGVTVDTGGINPEQITGPEGSGWVIEIGGHHFYNEGMTTWGGTHVRDTFMKSLREQTIELPTTPGRPPERFTMKELGIDFVILAADPPIDRNHREPNPYFEGQPGTSGASEAVSPSGYGPPVAGPAGFGAPLPGRTAAEAPEAGGPAAEPEEEEKESEPPFYAVPKYSFVVQFCWQEQQLTERLQKRQQPEQAAGPGESVAATNVGG
jgi:hypothetical protein